jgi:hypothetical protein
LFSEEVGKINQSGLYQSRFFVVTDTNIYNFKDRDFSRAQRVIPIRRLDGIVISSKSKEVVLQVHFEHDYHLDFTLPRSKQRDAFVNIVIQRYQSICGYRLLPQLVVHTMASVFVLIVLILMFVWCRMMTIWKCGFAKKTRCTSRKSLKRYPTK